ncbi:hypothetical protein EBS02_03780, partial [bacterium]|nr:hypothetical protein [bacterium]
MFNEFDPVYFVNHVHRVLKPSDDPVGEASIHGLSVASNVQIGTTDASLKIFRLDSTGNLTTSGSFIFKGLSGPLSNNVRVQGQLTVESGNGVLVNSISGITVTSSNSGNVFVKLLRTDANSSNFLRFIPEGSYSASHPQYWLGIDQNSYDLDLIRYDGSTELRLLKVNANGTIGILSGVTITGNLATSGTLTSRGNTELKANVSIAGNSTLTGTLSVN